MGAAAYYTPVETLSELSESEREKLILEHLGQVRLIARKIHERLPGSISFDDLFSSGVVGLINAIDNYDPQQNVKLRTYAEFRIRGAILDSLRAVDWAPRPQRRQAREFESAIQRAEQRLSRSPEEAEIAAELKLTLDEYRRRLTDMEAMNIGELEYQRDESDRPSLLRYVASPDDDSPAVTLEKSELEKLIANAIDRIPATEKTVLTLYFYEELTLREIAGILGIHLSRVSQIKSQAVLRLRNAISKRWPGVRA